MRLLDDDRRTGWHWNALIHARLSLDVCLLRIGPGGLVVNRLVWIIAGPNHWDSLHSARVLLRIAARSEVRGCVGVRGAARVIRGTARMIWGTSAMAVGWLAWDLHWHTGGGLIW